LAKDREAGRWGYTVKVVDFGIAKVPLEGDDRPTRPGAIVGTPYFMSPEALTGREVTSVADVWSLGACAYAAAVGQVPFDGKSLAEVALKVIRAPMPVPSHAEPRLPKSFDAWFARACARDPEERFQTVREAADSLLRLGEWAYVGPTPATAAGAGLMVAAASSVAPHPQLPDLSIPPPRASHRGLLLALILAAVAIAIGIAGYLAVQRARAIRGLDAPSTHAGSSVGHSP
jgi:serine/threonine-protein kinase